MAKGGDSVGRLNVLQAAALIMSSDLSDHEPDLTDHDRRNTH